MIVVIGSEVEFWRLFVLFMLHMNLAEISLGLAAASSSVRKTEAESETETEAKRKPKPERKPKRKPKKKQTWKPKRNLKRKPKWKPKREPKREPKRIPESRRSPIRNLTCRSIYIYHASKRVGYFRRTSRTSLLVALNWGMGHESCYCTIAFTRSMFIAKTATSFVGGSELWRAHVYRSLRSSAVHKFQTSRDRLVLARLDQGMIASKLGTSKSNWAQASKCMSRVWSTREFFFVLVVEPFQLFAFSFSFNSFFLSVLLWPGFLLLAVAAYQVYTPRCSWGYFEVHRLCPCCCGCLLSCSHVLCGSGIPHVHPPARSSGSKTNCWLNEDREFEARWRHLLRRSMMKCKKSRAK